MRYSAVTIKISGKIFTVQNIDTIREYSTLIRDLYESGLKIAVVVGGGEIARKYIELSRKLGVSASFQDQLGIEVSRINARLLSYTLWPYSTVEPPATLREAVSQFLQGKIVVMGGLQPGQSTASVAALLAEAINSDALILATTVEGVYTSDPHRDIRASLIPRLSYREFRNIVEQSSEPGRYELIEPYAIDILERSKIILHIVNGFKVDNIKKILEGQEVGSIVLP